MNSFADVPELVKLSGLPAAAVRRRLDLLDDDLVVVVGRARAVPRERVDEVVAELKRLPYAPRTRLTLREALAGR